MNLYTWFDGLSIETQAIQQLKETASLPFIFKHVAAMPDTHLGEGCCIGSVIPTKGYVVPSAVGCDIGCGMSAVKTSLNVSKLTDLHTIRTEIEKNIPHGRTNNGKSNDKGSWNTLPDHIQTVWNNELKTEFEEIITKHPKSKGYNNANHLGTLGTGNHFIEVCLDTENNVWFMIHSGSRGQGNRFGGYFSKLAREECKNETLPNPFLAYLKEGTELFNDYIKAATWAQKFAKLNRDVMMNILVNTIQSLTCDFDILLTTNCHHNYVNKETHFNEEIYVTRKGACSANKDQWVIIPGSMGSKSFICLGLGNPDSFNSCSHGAGRAMSRKEAKRTFTVEDHIKATEGVECKKDESVIDETPMAYKNIDAVIEAEKDLVMPIYTLKQIICVKG